MEHDKDQPLSYSGVAPEGMNGAGSVYIVDVYPEEGDVPVLGKADEEHFKNPSALSWDSITEAITNPMDSMGNAIDKVKALLTEEESRVNAAKSTTNEDHGIRYIEFDANTEEFALYLRTQFRGVIQKIGPMKIESEFSRYKGAGKTGIP